MWQMGAPVATPVTAGDCFTGISALVTCRDVHRNAFENGLRDLLRVPFVRGTNSGRAALFLTLQAMKQLSARTEVVVPGFVCPSVGRAVIKAGLKPVLCDVGRSGSGLAVESLERVLNRETLAVVTTHLYGYPSEIAPIMELSHSAGAMVIEDAAQAFGAKSHGRYVGTVADAGIFSFGMSKVLWSMGGGLIVTSNPELGYRIDGVMSVCKQPNNPFSETTDLIKFGILGVLLRSHHLGPLEAVWGASMRGKDDCGDFDAAVCSPSHAAVANRLLSRFNEITRVRKNNAACFSADLSRFEEITLPHVDAESEPVFLRFPIVVRDTRVKSKLFTCLRASGINVSEMYTGESYRAMRGFAARQSQCPQTEYLVERMLNLPTHHYMRDRDLNAALAAFESVLGPQQCRLNRTKAS